VGEEGRETRGERVKLGRKVEGKGEKQLKNRGSGKLPRGEGGRVVGLGGSVGGRRVREVEWGGEVAEGKEEVGLAEERDGEGGLRGGWRGAKWTRKCGAEREGKLGGPGGRLWGGGGGEVKGGTRGGVSGGVGNGLRGGW